MQKRIEVAIVCASCPNHNCINHPSTKYYRDTAHIQKKQKAIDCSYREINELAENIVELKEWDYKEREEEDEEE